jgi:ribosomal protein S21
MEIFVSGTLEAAIRILDRKMKVDGIERELKVRRFGKRSERVAYKKYLARRRKSRDESRRKKGRSEGR